MDKEERVEEENKETYLAFGLDLEKRKESTANKIVDFVRNNTAVIALMIPLLSLILNTIIVYLRYRYEQGYYSYFKVSDSFILFNSTITLYKTITIAVFIIIFILYAILSVRTFLKKRNYFMKIIILILIPFIFYSIIFFLALTEHTTAEIPGVLVTTLIMYIIFHSPCTYACGYCFFPQLSSDLIAAREMEKEKEKRKKQNNSKRINKKKKDSKTKSSKTRIKKNDKENGVDGKSYAIVGIIIMIFAIVIAVLTLYSSGKTNAEIKKDFFITKIGEEYYAVLGENGDECIVEEADINAKSNGESELVIYTCPYRKISCKGLDIYDCSFDNVTINPDAKKDDN